MKLPNKNSKIVCRTYNGQKDDEGRPHGDGTMEYSTSTGKKYRYKGNFVHGVRSGYGVLYEHSHYIREYEEWEWVQMGEYDSAGRLIHPNTKPGPYKEIVDVWEDVFKGWWRNDDASHSLRHKKYGDDNFEYSEDAKFLSHFHDLNAVRKFSTSTVSKLQISMKPYARYGYGVWLWASRKDSTSMKAAFKIFEDSARAGIADAVHFLSRMYYFGEAYDETTGKFVLDRKLSEELHVQAIEKGSILAKLKHNSNLFFGTADIEADKATAIANAERESSALFCESILWTDQLGWFYAMEGETEKAIQAYEKCIVNGFYSPICNIAIMCLQDGDSEYYETLMKVGMELEVPDCSILGIEYESNWDTLDDYDRNKIHGKLKYNLQEGVSQGSGFCAYILTDAYLNGKFGFDIDFCKGMSYADIAMTYGNYHAANLVIMAAETLRDSEFMSDDELLELKYEALRYGNEEHLDYILKNKDTYISMGYGEDIEKVWIPLWNKRHPDSLDLHSI